MICKECGAKMNESTRFCTRCGARIQRTKTHEDAMGGESLPENTVSSGPKIVGSIKEATKNGATHNNRVPKRKGCIWTVIKWFLIISVISVLLSECGFGSDSAGDGNRQNSTGGVLSSEPQAVEESVNLPDNMYELIMITGRRNIDTLLAENPMDMDALRSEYEFLLALKINEFVFKVSAYGYHTGEYKENAFADIAEKSGEICKEMKKYFPDDEVDKFYLDIVSIAYYSFDETKIDYDALLVGSKKRPDVDTMWLRFVESMVGSSEVDVRTAIQNHNMEVYSTLVPTEQTEVPDITEFPTEEFQPPTETVHSQEVTGTVLKILWRTKCS